MGEDQSKEELGKAKGDYRLPGGSELAKVVAFSPDSLFLFASRHSVARTQSFGRGGQISCSFPTNPDLGVTCFTARQWDLECLANRNAARFFPPTTSSVLNCA